MKVSEEELAQNTEQFKKTESLELREELYVHEVYNEIASHFSQTRYKPWPIVEKFLKERQDYTVGIDVGCGNGKYLRVNEKLCILGSDHSSGLIGCAVGVNNNPLNDLMIADGLSLPHHDNRFDFAISILVIHHFSSKQRRVEAISEILRCLKKGASLLVYCWALEQENSRRGYHEGMDQDILVPWVQKEGNTRMRYYHMYKKGELVEDCVLLGGEVVEDGYERDNWWCVVKAV